MIRGRQRPRKNKRIFDSMSVVPESCRASSIPIPPSPFPHTRTINTSLVLHPSVNCQLSMPLCQSSASSTTFSPQWVIWLSKVRYGTSTVSVLVLHSHEKCNVWCHVQSEPASRCEFGRALHGKPPFHSRISAYQWTGAHRVYYRQPLDPKLCSWLIAQSDNFPIWVDTKLRRSIAIGSAVRRMWDQCETNVSTNVCTRYCTKSLEPYSIGKIVTTMQLPVHLRGQHLCIWGHPHDSW